MTDRAPSLGGDHAREDDDIVAKHLLNETAEFSLATLGRHAADGEDEPGDLTQRLDGGPRRQPPVPGRPEADGRTR